MDLRDRIKGAVESLADKPLPGPVDVGGYMMKTTPCIKSGFCCTKAPCAYGEWNDDRSACVHLSKPNEIGQRVCGRYDWIKENVPGWENYPAFGAGCCMPMFNEARASIITKYIENEERKQKI